MPRIHVVIPARYDSARLPGKPLELIAGKPMIQHVYERASNCEFVDGVTVASDDQRVADAVRAFNGSIELTSKAHLNGTSRVAEVAKSLSAEIIVNLQGDEPLIKPESIEKVIIPLINDDKLEMTSLMSPIENKFDLLNPNVVKVLTSDDNFAIYFSRFPIPFNTKLWDSERAPINEKWLNYLKKIEKDIPHPNTQTFKHIGVYAFRRTTLLKYQNWRQDSWEISEQLEQLRFLSQGIKIKMNITNNHFSGVDTLEDLEEVRKLVEKL